MHMAEGVPGGPAPASATTGKPGTEFRLPTDVYPKVSDIRAGAGRGHRREGRVILLRKSEYSLTESTTP